jgi:hypothetical protein
VLPQPHCTHECYDSLPPPGTARSSGICLQRRTACAGITQSASDCGSTTTTRQCVGAAYAGASSASTRSCRFSCLLARRFGQLNRFRRMRRSKGVRPGATAVRCLIGSCLGGSWRGHKDGCARQFGQNGGGGAPLHLARRMAPHRDRAKRRYPPRVTRARMMPDGRACGSRGRWHGSLHPTLHEPGTRGREAQRFLCRRARWLMGSKRRGCAVSTQRARPSPDGRRLHSLTATHASYSFRSARMNARGCAPRAIQSVDRRSAQLSSAQQRNATQRSLL